MKITRKYRVIPYGRFSSINQNDLSIEAQVAQCRKAAEGKGWEFVEDRLFSDEARTGATIFGRDGINDAIARVKSKDRDWDGLIVDETSRIARNLSDLLRICDIFTHHKAFIYFVSRGLDTRDPHFRDLVIINGQRDEGALTNLAYEVHRSQVHRVENGLVPCGRCFGYDHDLIEDLSRLKWGRPVIVGVKYVINKDEAIIIRRMFDLRGQGYSYRKICRALKDEGIKRTRLYKQRRLDCWTQSTIGKTLSNRRYLGIIPFNHTHQSRDPETGKKVAQPSDSSEWIEKVVPELRIISDEQWERAHSHSKASKERTSGWWGGIMRADTLFTSVLRCGVCGGSFTIVSGNLNDVRKGYYGCMAKRQDDACKNKLTIRRDRLEKQLLSGIVEALSMPVATDHMIKEFKIALEDEFAKRSREVTSTEISDHKQEKVELERAIHNLLELAEKDGLASSPSIASRLKENESRLAAINRRLQTEPLDSPDFSVDHLRLFLAEQSANLVSILTGDVSTARLALLKHIGKIKMFPEDNNYRAEARIKLFVGDEEFYPRLFAQLNLIGKNVSQLCDFFSVSVSALLRPMWREKRVQQKALTKDSRGRFTSKLKS